MRQIGTLTEERAAQHLADHLSTLGVTARVREESDGWGIWVLDENRLPQARQEFDAFRSDPDDPRFQAASHKAEVIRREAERIDSRYRKNVRDVSRTWGRTPFRRRPVTMILVAISVIVFLLQSVRATGMQVTDALAFSPIVRKADAQGRQHPDLLGVDDIARGELWRLVTPIFMHGGPIHLLFNIYMLMILGTLIETRRGPWVLAALVVFAAVTSNVVQHIYNLRFVGEPRLFMGMSGVNYALFGYVWMKGRHEPEQGMILHPSTVQMMLIWLVLCMTGLVGNVANAAHVVGMVVGILYGLARF